MPRSANALSALNSAPGSLGSENTIEVLSGTLSLNGRRPMTRNRVMLSLVVLNRRGQRGQTEHLAGPGRGDRRGVLELLVGHHLRAAGGVVGRDDLDAASACAGTARTAPAPADASTRGCTRPSRRPAAPAGDGRPATPPRRRSADGARAAGRSCDGCCRQSSSRSAARRTRPVRLRPRRTRPRSSGRRGARVSGDRREAASLNAPGSP